jgi:hypothetical protein
MGGASGLKENLTKARLSILHWTNISPIILQEYALSQNSKITVVAETGDVELRKVMCGRS